MGVEPATSARRYRGGEDGFLRRPVASAAAKPFPQSLPLPLAYGIYYLTTGISMESFSPPLRKNWDFGPRRGP